MTAGSTPRTSLLRMSAFARIALALAMVAAIWATVMWATAP
jgi:hypothetical protein